MHTITSKVQYKGKLRTVAQHMASGETITTDAPTDNQGQGAYFSPTDMVATSLATCMLTLMGIAANNHQIEFGNCDVEVTKIMAANPRRISKVVVSMSIHNKDFSDKQVAILEQAARTCPVAMSLHPDIQQDVTFNYYR